MRPLLIALLLTSFARAEKRHTHDGFQLSLGVGPTYAFTGGEYTNGADEDVLITAEGVGVGGMILAGYTVAEGLVVGGGTMGGHTLSPSGKTELVDTEGSAVDRDADSDVVFNVAGPYLDYYANENDGLHGLILVGLATLEDGDDRSDGIALGWGFVLGVGYDWWVADDWSLGVLARLHVLSTSHELKVDDELVDIDYRTAAASVLFTTVWH